MSSLVKVTFTSISPGSSLGGIPLIGTDEPYLFPSTIDVSPTLTWGQLITNLLSRVDSKRHHPMLNLMFGKFKWILIPQKFF